MNQQLDLFAATVSEEIETNEESKSELTPRAWALYRLIYHNSMVEHRKTTQKEIYLNIQGYEWNNDEKCHDHCPTIWSDVTKNNLSFEHDKIIISKNFEYWIGNEQETKDFIEDLWNQLSPRLTRYWFYKQKVSMNGQGKLLSNQLNPIDMNSKAREFVESYNPYKVGE